MNIVTSLTDLADMAVILPVAGLTGVGFAMTGWRRAAVVWFAVVTATFGLMLLLKLASMSCGHLFLDGGLLSPSGHTAAAGMVYGGMLAAAVRWATGRTGWTLPCAAAIALLIGATRLILGVHTVPEVVLGSLVGIAGAAALIWLAGPPPARLRPGRAVPLLIAVIVIFHGSHFPAEAFIRDASRRVWPLTECSPPGENQAGQLLQQGIRAATAWVDGGSALLAIDSAGKGTGQSGG